MNYVDELLPDLRFQAPDVADTTLRRTLRLAVQDFLRDSEIWQPVFDPVYTFEGVDCYDLGIPQGARIGRMLWVKMEGRDLPPLEAEDMAEDARFGYMITNTIPHEIMLAKHVDRGYLKFGAAIFPTSDCEELPDYLVEDFRTPMLRAALARIYATAGSEWFDPNMAALFSASVNAAIVEGKRMISNRRKGKRRTVRYGGY